jgi:hypothetical protein
MIRSSTLISLDIDVIAPALGQEILVPEASHLSRTRLLAALPMGVPKGVHQYTAGISASHLLHIGLTV